MREPYKFWREDEQFDDDADDDDDDVDRLTGSAADDADEADKPKPSKTFIIRAEPVELLLLSVVGVLCVRVSPAVNLLSLYNTQDHPPTHSKQHINSSASFKF